MGGRGWGRSRPTPPPLRPAVGRLAIRPQQGHQGRHVDERVVVRLEDVVDVVVFDGVLRGLGLGLGLGVRRRKGAGAGAGCRLPPRPTSKMKYVLYRIDL